MKLPITPAVALTALGLAAALQPVGAATPAEIASAYAQQAPAPASATRGQQFFTARHGAEWSCASCHGEVPVGTGRHSSTGRGITPLAPAVNPERFTDPAKVEKWLRRNCRDVATRECSAQEKADVLAFLTQLKP